MLKAIRDLIYDPCRPPVEQALLSQLHVEHDVGVLVYALEKAYPGQLKMKPANWSEILKDLQSIAGSKELSSTDLGVLIADILWRIPDGHLRVYQDGQVLGAQVHRNMRQPSCGLNIAKDRVWGIESRISGDLTCSIIGLSRFPQPSEPTWNGFQEQIQHCLNSDVIVVDLRGNRGGNDWMGIKLASMLMDQDLQFDWIFEVICESTASYALQANTFRKIIYQNYLVHNLTPPAELVAELNHYLSLAESFENDDVSIFREVKPSPSLSPSLGACPFQGPIFVLVDSNTMSSGEWTALYLKRHPNTILVGENTCGMIHFGNSGLLSLPKSGLEVSICMKTNQFVDGQFYEKQGVPPDWPISGQDALEVLLAQNFSR